MSISVPFYSNPYTSFLVIDNMSNDDKIRYLEEVEWQTINSHMQHYLNMIDNNLCIATESEHEHQGVPNGMHSGGITFKQWFMDVFQLFKRIVNRVYKLGRTLVEKVTKRYETITKLWEGTIQRNLDKIVEEHFDEVVVKCISLDTLKKRIEIIGNIQNVIEAIEPIVKAPIYHPDDPNAYNTPEFVECYKAIQEIGLSIKNKTFVESQSGKYKNALKKTTISELGYNKSNLPELVEFAKSIASLATSKWVKNTTTQFTQIHNGLTEQEKKIIKNKNLNEIQKKEELKKIQIRISRLWWISNYIHLLNELADDCMKYILTIFRAAYDSIPLSTNDRADETGGNKYYF